MLTLVASRDAARVHADLPRSMRPDKGAPWGCR